MSERKQKAEVVPVKKETAKKMGSLPEQIPCSPPE